jgi:exopolyphosphatase/guanosine-5'-triphosphate,3'-diphosphate pyrophosphatase
MADSPDLHNRIDTARYGSLVLIEKQGNPDVVEASSRVVAAVDLGSNSFHIIVSRLENGALRVIDQLREPVRLAEGLDERNELSLDAQRRALDALQRFGQRLRELDSWNVRAVGTNTFRAADNTIGFLAQAEQALGHPIDIISGIEEARLIYLGVAHSLSNDGNRRLVVDIGGGSTELIVGQDLEALDMNSFYMGCVTMSQRFFPGGTITAKAMSKAETAAKQELEPVETSYRSARWSSAIGASGTIKAAAAIAHACGWGDDPGKISWSALKKLRKALIDAGNSEALDLKGLSASRKPVLPGGVSILRAVFSILDIDTMQVASGALREGLLYDLVGRIYHQDVRERSVHALAVRCTVDQKQAQRVRDTALRLLRTVGEGWNLQDEEMGQMLAWAAQLHECGMMVAYNQYHKHGAYIISNANLAGFSQQEKQLLAMLVRAHRRKFPLAEVKALPGRWHQPAIRLAILLRIAVTLNRGRADMSLPSIHVTAGKNAIALNIPHDWLDQHPLTRVDLKSEATYLSAISYKLVTS